MARAALDTGRRLKRAVRTEGHVLSPAEAALTGLTAGAVRVFEEICTLARLNAGRVFPSYNRLAEATALGRATVARALAALERAGFLVRQRRFKRVEGGPTLCPDVQRLSPDGSATLAAPPAALDDPGADP
ncbi:helix-turn-helix domain-containing protein [Novosphingobium panipatense]|uniref:helix-turn-helix domain-containing protein n=1 Tax=Novosphingobium panipatense TaxID=428991 RepID=UPI00360E8CCB